MLECPNCKEKTIKKTKKFWLGPARSIQCDHCGCKVSIPYSSLFLMTLYLGFMLVLPKIGIRSPYMVILLVVLCIGFTYSFYKFVPLIVKLKKDDRGYRKQKSMNTLMGMAYIIISFGMIYIMIWKMR